LSPADIQIRASPRASDDLRKQFEDDPEGPTGKAVRYTPRKNRKKVKTIFLPVLPELQTFMADLKVQRTDGFARGPG
jgi:hypothetical protein